MIKNGAAAGGWQAEFGEEGRESDRKRLHLMVHNTGGEPGADADWAWIIGGPRLSADIRGPDTVSVSTSRCQQRARILSNVALSAQKLAASVKLLTRQAPMLPSKDYCDTSTDFLELLLIRIRLKVHV